MEIGDDRNTIYVLENWRFGQWSFGQYKKIPPLLEPHRYRILLPLILKQVEDGNFTLWQL